MPPRPPLRRIDVAYTTATATPHTPSPDPTGVGSIGALFTPATGMVQILSAASGVVTNAGAASDVGPSKYDIVF